MSQIIIGSGGGGGGGGTTSFQTDAGVATPAAGVIQILGGTDVTTSGAGDTVTINATGGGLIPWIDIPSATLTAAANTGYVHFTFPTAVTITLPTGVPFGTIVSVVASNNVASTTVDTPVGVDLQVPGSGINAYSSVEADGYGSATFLCTEVDAEWQMIDSTGTWNASI